MVVVLSFNLSDDEGIYLVKLAREAVEEFLTGRRKIHVPERLSPSLTVKAGVFVTLNTVTASGRELRGCIGFPYPILPLAEAVIDAAIDSAVGDPRFQPVTLREMDGIVVEVSVLTPPQLVIVNKPTELPSKVKVGEDGLIVERGTRKGLLLPQVPVEWGWDSEEFLMQCCLKAGLPTDSWLLTGTRVYRFQAIIFDEETPRGCISRRSLVGC